MGSTPFSGRSFCIRSRMRKDPVSGGRVRTRAVHQPFVAGVFPGHLIPGGSGSSLSAAYAYLQFRLKVHWSLELDPPFLPVSVHPGSEGRSCLVDSGENLLQGPRSGPLLLFTPVSDTLRRGGVLTSSTDTCSVV